MASNYITKPGWNEIEKILRRYEIPYTVHYERRYVEQAMEKPDIMITDKHIQINLIIADYFDEIKRDD